MSEQGPRGEGGGAEGEKLSNKRKKETMHNQGGLEGKGKEKTGRSKSVPCPKQTAKQGSSSVGRKGVGQGQEEAL